MRFSLALLLLLPFSFACTSPASADAAPSRLTASFDQAGNGAISTKDGSVSLSWKASRKTSTPLRFEVERSASPDFSNSRIVYKGKDSATFVSGLPAGDFYFRVRTARAGKSFGPWTKNPVEVSVDYVSYRLVWLLMIAGAITFVAIVATILTGHARTSRAA